MWNTEYNELQMKAIKYTIAKFKFIKVHFHITTPTFPWPTSHYIQQPWYKQSDVHSPLLQHTLQPPTPGILFGLCLEKGSTYWPSFILIWAL